MRPGARTSWRDKGFPDAAKKGSLKAVHALLEAGGDPNRANRWGDTLLHEAAQRGKAEAVRILLEAGADPERPNREGQTPLELAVGRGGKVLETFLARPRSRTKTLLALAGR
ncbi:MULTISPECIES: ankyrin repeat domain-containing protein [unclassified Meiothermus]|uniref:ankyrin repeat domain-containing protein n=1 Tax=unclassified Meiothermus TaxID=370471 RepID=UPI000D7CE1C6|nr:hypothetical protein DNA98_16175 [Meiothermus sp. Pnk-1]RYM35273.1 ankyrin repeat domain-containing protein [Meiothermus sp. PNK-Is4]